VGCAPGAALDDGEELLKEVDGERRVLALAARPVQAAVVLGVHVRGWVPVLIVLVHLLHVQVVVIESVGAAFAVNSRRKAQ
jgi:hypothetical protein